MFPHVVAHDWYMTLHERIILIWGADYLKSAATVAHKPHPTGTETLRTLFIKLRFEISEAAKRTLDSIGNRAARFPTAAWSHDLPEHRVIDVTTGVIANRCAHIFR